eukprot:10776721-Lingulodinium_polyedra.AAC.1
MERKSQIEGQGSMEVLVKAAMSLTAAGDDTEQLETHVKELHSVLDALKAVSIGLWRRAARA